MFKFLSYDFSGMLNTQISSLLLLSHFSRVRLCMTPQMAAHQAPPSLEFFRQEHWSGLPFPSPARESEVSQSCPTLCDLMDCSLPGSSVHDSFQARALAWGATAFSEYQVQVGPMEEAAHSSKTQNFLRSLQRTCQGRLY